MLFSQRMKLAAELEENFKRAETAQNISITRNAFNIIGALDFHGWLREKPEPYLKGSDNEKQKLEAGPACNAEG